MNPTSRAGAPGQTLQLYLYRRCLHPDLFALKGRRTLAGPGVGGGSYELEAWIMPAGHVLRFAYGVLTCCELVTDHDDRLPMDGAITGFPCLGEQEFKHEFLDGRVKYSAAAQSETLSSNLYRQTYDDMLDYAKATEAVSYKYEDADGRKCLSLLELHGLPKEVHAEGFHLMASGGLVVRTQTIFSHA